MFIMQSRIYVPLVFLIGLWSHEAEVFGIHVISFFEVNEKPNVTIVNGSNTTIDQYPIDVAFMVAKDIWGAGVIFNHSWILTTAFNCLWLDPKYITIRVGSSSWNSSGAVYTADKCLSHPQYKGSWANDIALLKINGEIKFGPNSKVGYKPSRNFTAPGTQLFVSGWGISGSSLEKSNQLQYSVQTVSTLEDCSAHYNLSGGTSFCASNPTSGPCAFDFGAPLNYKRQVVGLYQGSVDCTKPQSYPALYTDVQKFSKWIEETMENN